MYGQKYFAYGQKSGQGPIPTALTIWANFFGKTQQMLQSLVCWRIYKKKGCHAHVTYISHPGTNGRRQVEVDNIRTNPI